MSKHHASNTLSTQKWCGKCKRMTDHSVSANREGRCMECGKKRPILILKSNSVEIRVPCTCLEKPYPHDPATHKALPAEMRRDER